jgi:HlyD family secretion protein
MVTEGKPILRVEPDTSEIEAVIYVPAEEAKKIQIDERGQPRAFIAARISPTTVKPEEFGFIEGKVRNVSAYPVTKDGLIRVLHTDTLVERLTKDGAPIEVRVTLSRAATPSGYKWSSSIGPQVAISTGTLCQGSFEIARKTPISYVIPAIRKTLGME